MALKRRVDDTFSKKDNATNGPPSHATKPSQECGSTQQQTAANVNDEAKKPSHRLPIRSDTMPLPQTKLISEKGTSNKQTLAEKPQGFNALEQVHRLLDAALWDIQIFLWMDTTRSAASDHKHGHYDGVDYYECIPQMQHQVGILEQTNDALSEAMNNLKRTDILSLAQGVASFRVMMEDVAKIPRAVKMLR